MNPILAVAVVIVVVAFIILQPTLTMLWYAR
jgi:hypothetical protein